MKYIITGSLGNTSKPIAASLIADGHEVVVITSDSTKAAQIEKMGAKPAVGSLTDREFVMKTFRDGDVAYLMIPPNFVVDDYPAYQEQVADNYRDAIANSKIRHVVVLSSIGAHLGKGAGPIDGLAYLEQQLQTLDVNAIFLRPSYYFSNFLNSVEMLR